MLGKQRVSTGSTSSSKGRNPVAGPSSSTKTGKQVLNSPSSSPETTAIPHIKTQDNAKLLPKYFAALQKPQDSHLPADELDAVQLELELLLSTVALRYRVLKTEYDTLDRAEDRREKKKYVERQRRLEEKQSKSKDSKFSASQSKSSKIKNLSTAVPSSPAASQQTDDSMDGIQHQKDTPKLLPKNDTPNRFWLSVEPYCMPISHEDIKLLDDLIEDYTGPSITPIPDLGPHYSTKWATEDIEDEQDNANPNTKSKSRNNGTQSGDVIGLIKKGEKLMGENITGPLTQRLVSALMEENLIPENNGRNSENGGENITSNSRPTMSMMKNGISIERRVRKELIEQGLLDADDFAKGQSDDEILSEVKRVRTELSAISEYNGNELKRLYSAAQEEMKRLEIKRKLDVVDQEIIETYKKISAARQKRRALTKQEREDVFRLTEEQKQLSDQLESMPLPGSLG